MSMQTMNPNAGGPVGGMLMMNNGSPAVTVGVGDARSTLNAYIYDYLLKNGHYDSARSLANDGKFDFPHGNKLSPGRRKDGDMNGDADGMDMDSKDDAPDDLPRPQYWTGTSGSAFLYEWFNIFMDLFSVHSNRNTGGKTAVQAAQYLMHEKSNQRLREQIQNQNLNMNNMNMNRNNAMVQQMRSANGMPNGKMPPGVSPQQFAAMQAKQRQQMVIQQQMNGPRNEADDGVNAVRPGTPTDGEAAGSPSKRQRLDNGQQNFPPGMMPTNGQRPGVAAAQNQAMLMQTPFNPAMAQAQFRQPNGAMPQKPMQVPNNMMNASSPMMPNMTQFTENMNIDMYNRGNMPGQQPMQGTGPQSSGNHALQDYQMQLMLLEQQNKKRLMMARQEQHENQPNAAGMQGVTMQGLSPSNSRTGSPSANEGLNGRSPAGMNFMGNMQGADFNPMFMKDQQMMPGGQQMRPPTSNDLNMQRAAAAARPNFQGGQPMQQQGSQAGQQMGTPGQRNEMPPPSAPAAGAQQRNNGNSPSGNAPPTPQQTNKANPKGKKGAAAKEDAKRARPNKKGSTANAPTSDDNPPATPQPSTPITPNNPGVMNNGNKGQPGMQAGNQHQQNQNMPMNQQMAQNDFQMDFNAGSGPGGEPFNLDFSTLENADVLENFDFDSFLNTSADEGFNFGGDVEIGQGFGMGEGE